MENLKKKVHDLEDELKLKQNSIQWVHQTYQGIIQDASRVHEYVSSLLKTYNFDKHSGKILKEVYGNSEPPKDDSEVESKPDLENGEMEEDEPVQKTDPDMLQDGSKFQQYLSSLLTTLTNACNFVENLEKIRKEVKENHQQRIQSLKEYYELKIEKIGKSSSGERLSQVNEMSALKEKIIEQLEFELNVFRDEKEKLTKQNSENNEKICKIEEELVKKEDEISKLQEKLMSKEKEIFENDRKIKNLEKELVTNSKIADSVIMCDATTLTEPVDEEIVNPTVADTGTSTTNEKYLTENNPVVPVDDCITMYTISNETNNPKTAISSFTAKMNPVVVVEDCGKKMDLQDDSSADESSSITSSSTPSPVSPMVLRSKSSPMISRNSMDDTILDSSDHDDSSVSDVNSPELPIDSDSDSPLSSRKTNIRLGRKRKHDLSNESLKPSGPCPKACKSCHKSFKPLNYERPFTRTYRDIKYKTRDTLRAHQLIRTAVEKHRCTLCPKSFCRKDHLTQHQVVHSDEKPFTCVLCGKLFKFKSKLKAHEFTHEIKQFSCSVCYKRFRF